VGGRGGDVAMWRCGVSDRGEARCSVIYAKVQRSSTRSSPMILLP